ncbi:anthranilate synthase component II [Coralliovum pocilloporae]|uniref:anthranilate synthase component II n=1 Tax=Coralliovum pocilloporae TaxID=3066369 RepID=UPI0033078EFF
MILMIDNYDSFTYNLVHYLGELGAELSVVRNDKISVDDIRALDPDAIVISPGPCTPNEAGICLDLIEAFATEIPIFGVCLGFQSIGQAFGGKVIRAPYLMHGKLSPMHHGNRGVFRDLPDPITATRYHSLIVERESLPDCLEITAETEDGIIMGFHHKSLPIHGVQFHPESIASEGGYDILKHFLAIAEDWNTETGRRTKSDG